MKEQLKYIVYITTENGDGYVQKLWEGECLEDFVLFTDILAAGCKITIDVK